jgi:GNAT superfamily N-acetyltransferase
MPIVRANTHRLADARFLLNEYYEAVQVQKRDTPEEIRGYLSDPDSSLWIAYVNEAPAACIVLRPVPSIPSAAECKRLYVRPEYRGQHLAQALLDTMEDHARANGIGRIYLDSKEDLKPALHLYTQRGYHPCERYNDNPQATIFLLKDLAGPSALKKG